MLHKAEVETRQTQFKYVFVRMSTQTESTFVLQLQIALERKEKNVKAFSTTVLHKQNFQHVETVNNYDKTEKLQKERTSVRFFCQESQKTTVNLHTRTLKIVIFN